MGQVVTREELEALLKADRAAGRSIAFANGCFDVLHVGHIRYLEGARAQADRLIVAINDDASVRTLKGPNRPILSAADRAALVSALRSVDYVIVFSDLDVNELLGTLKPDVHCKGTDYTVSTVPERDTVRAYGGRTAIVGDPKDHSTRDLIARIRDAGDPAPRQTRGALSPPKGSTKKSRGAARGDGVPASDALRGGRGPTTQK
jgi:D-glycero-beta-D-manno-heptose 1-phosphate adenylyltransferase